MNRHKILVAAVAGLMGLQYAHTTEHMTITEEKLEQLSQGHAPDLDKITATMLQSQSNESAADEAYQAELYGKTSYAENHARAIIPFQPIFSPVKQFQVGVKQNYRAGVQATLDMTTSQQSANTTFGRFNNATQTMLSFTLNVDLWKDLFGRVSKAKTENLQLQSRKSELEKEINQKSFQLSLRKIYWALVANAESLKISEGLLKTAEQQARESKIRQQNAVAEADEVARYDAQVASRQGAIVYLKYQRENLYKQLMALLPDLNQHKFEVAPTNLDDTVRTVLACTHFIATQHSTPLQYTKYDEIIALLREIKGNDKKINDRYSDIDVKMFGTVRETGVGSNNTAPNYYGGSVGSSFTDMRVNNRSGYEVGVQVSVPLGSKKDNTKKIKDLYDEKNMASAIDSTQAQVESTHHQITRSVPLLLEAVRAQKQSTKELEKRLEFSRRKFAQARISVNDLINDQDALLNSKLNTISTQLEIVNNLLNYFAVYTDTPCEFNRNTKI